MPIKMTDITYRLFRLRRLFVLMMLLPLVGVWIANLLSGGQTVLVTQPVLLPLSLIWAICASASIVRFPRAVEELIALSLTVAIEAASFPLVEALVGLKSTAASFGELAMLGLLMAFIWLVLFIALAVICCNAPVWGPRFSRKTRIVVHSKLPAEQVFAGLAFAPDLNGPVYSSGPADADGFFPVYGNLKDVPPEGSMNEAKLEKLRKAAMGVQYRVKIEGRGPLWQSELIVTKDKTSSARLFEVITVENGCRIESTEIHDNFTPLMALLFWLSDAGGDISVARLERLAGHPPRAIWAQDIDSPLCWLARKLPKDGEPSF